MRLSKAAEANAVLTVPVTLFQSIIETWPDHILLMDTEGHFLFSNNAVFTGGDGSVIGRDDIIGKTFVETGFPPYLQTVAERALRKVITTGQVVTQNVDIATEGGLERHFECQFAPVHDLTGKKEPGKVRAIVVRARDITEQVAVTKELQLRDMAVNSANGGIVITDPSLPDNPIVFANDGFLRLTGYSRTEVVGRNCRFLQGTGTDKNTVSKIRQALNEEREIRVLLLNYRKDGTPFWNDLDMTPVRDPAGSGKVLNFIGVQTDVTERKMAEEVLRRDRDRNQRLAADLQRSLLIQPSQSSVEGLQIDVNYEPALSEALVGGDFYDVLPIDDEWCLFAVGDASGKGIKAALRMVEVKFALRAYAREGIEADVILQRLNAFLTASARDARQGADDQAIFDEQARFVALALAIVNRRDGRFRLATAGSEAIYRLITEEGERRIAPLHNANLPLCVMADETFQQHVGRLAPGESLMLLTDGVLEARPPRADHFFGEEGVEKAWAEFTGSGIEGYTNFLSRRAIAHAGGRANDDICALTVRWPGAPA